MRHLAAGCCTFHWGRSVRGDTGQCDSRKFRLYYPGNRRQPDECHAAGVTDGDSGNAKLLPCNYFGSESHTGQSEHHVDGNGDSAKRIHWERHAELYPRISWDVRLRAASPDADNCGNPIYRDIEQRDGRNVHLRYLRNRRHAHKHHLRRDFGGWIGRSDAGISNYSNANSKFRGRESSERNLEGNADGLEWIHWHRHPELHDRSSPNLCAFGTAGADRRWRSVHRDVG